MKNQPDIKGKITALYERLSKDDDQEGDSNSIAHQKQILEDYAEKNGFHNIRHFTDDGIRGTTFRRPGLDAMLEEVKAGRVATVIIKDQSRIGRDVVEVGLLKRTFDEYKVRFIAANDNLDTAQGFNIMSIFKDVINEWFVAETSQKIKSVFKSRMENGVSCSGSLPYGFLADKEAKGKVVVDEDAAGVVRRIFQMVIDGKGVNEIGRILRAEQIPIPCEHYKRIGAPYRRVEWADPYAWSSTTIGAILSRQEYKGFKVLGKTVCESYKTKTHRKTAPEERYYFEGALPVIVDEETWENAQRLRKTVRRPPKRDEPPHRLTGLLFCADCNSRMSRHLNLAKKRWVSDSYGCSRYRKLTRDCTMHYIPTKNVENLILSAIKRISWYVKDNEQEFIEKVREASTAQQEETVKECKRRLSQSQRRHNELDNLVKKLYEANATGKLSDRHFDRLLADYDAEQSDLEAAITDMQGQINAWSEDKLKTDRFIELAKRYTDFSELTTPMLNEFVDRVVVHEGDKRGAERCQRVDIYMNFIGAFNIPADVVTPMELEEQRRLMEEKAAKEQHSKELKRERADERNKKNREFTARMMEGLLTPEEMEAHEQKKAHSREWQKEWRDKRKAAEPPKPPKPLSRNAIIKRRSEGLPLTPEEQEIYRAYQDKKTEQARERRHRIKASEPPKPKKPTRKEIMTDIIARKNSGQPLTPEESEAYDLYREDRNAKNKIWRDSKSADKPPKIYIAEIARLLKAGMPITPDEAAAYDSWREKKSERQRKWRENNKDYQREWRMRNKADDMSMAANQRQATP